MIAMLLLLACGRQDVETGDTGDNMLEAVQVSEFTCDDLEYDANLDAEGWTLDGASSIVNVQVCEETDEGVYCALTTGWGWWLERHFLTVSCQSNYAYYQVLWN